MLSLLLYIFIIFYILGAICNIALFSCIIGNQIRFFVKNPLLLFIIVSICVHITYYDLLNLDLNVYAICGNDNPSIISDSTAVTNNTTTNPVVDSTSVSTPASTSNPAATSTSLNSTASSGASTPTASKSSINVNAGINVSNLQTEAVNKLAEAGKLIGEGLKSVGDNMVGLAGGAAAMAGAKVSVNMGGTPIQKIGAALAGGALGSQIYVAGVSKARSALNKNPHIKRYDGSSTNSGSSASDSVNVSGNISGNISTESTNSTNNEFVSTGFNNTPVLDLDPNVDTINNVLDTLVNSNHSLLIINSPLENSPLFDLLHSTMIMNVCSMVLLLTLFTTFLQILAVVRSFNLDFIDRLHFLKGLRSPIKRIILKWQNLSSKSLFIYFFVWWLLLYASAYYTVDHLQFILDNLDSMIDQHIEFKK